MGWMDEYNALKKKRKEEVENSKAPFMESYQYLKTKRTGNELNDQQPVNLDGIYYEDNVYRIPYRPIDPNDNLLGKAVTGYGNVLAAIVNNSKPVDTSDRSWFESGPFLDGYDLFDVSKAIIGTAADVKDDVVEGIVGMAEPTMDAILYGGGFLLDKAGSLIFGKKNWNDQWALDRAMNGKGFFTSENGDSSFQQSLSEVISKDIINEESVTKVLGFDALKAVGIDHEDYSVLGDKSDSLVQSGGQLATTYGLNALGLPWFVTSGITSFGSELENAVKQGASVDEAGTSAAFAAASEIITEKIFDGFSFGGKTIADVTLNPLIDKISNKVIRTLVKFDVDLAGEGIEEVLSRYGSAIGQQLTYADEKELNELFSKEDRWDAFIGGIIMSLGGNGIALGKSIKNGVDYVSGMTADEEAVVNKETENRISALEEDGTELKASEKRNIKELVKSFLDKGSISTDTIEEVLGGETYNTYKDTVDSEDAQIKQLEDQIKELGDAPNTVGNYKKFDALQQQLDELKNNSKRTQLKSQLSEEVFSRVKNSRLVESYNENGRRSQAYQADLTKYDEKQRETIQRAIDSGILNNTNRTHEFVDMVAKVSADKGVLFDFTNNEKLKDSVFAVEGKTVNGYFDKQNGVVGVNIDSAKALNTVVGHEITHVLKDTELYDAMKETLFEYAKSKGEYQSRYDALVELYKDVKDADIEAELAADLVGDYLFTDADFINHLSIKNRNVFQKIYDELLYLYKIATAGSKEARELEKVKKAFEKAYRAKKDTAVTSGTKYSLTDKTTPSYEELVTKNPVKIVKVKDGIASGSYADMKTAAMDKAKSEGWFNNPHHNNDTDSLIFLTEKSYSHAYSKLTASFGEDTIRSMAHIPEIIENAVLVSVDPPRNPNKQESQVYTFFGAIDGVGGIEPVKLTVKEYDFSTLEAVPKNIRSYFEKNGVMKSYDSLYDAHALEVIGIEGIKKESDASGKVNEHGSQAQATSDSAISIADLLNLVKGDATKYIPKKQYSLSDSDGKQLSGEKINRVTEDGLTMTYVRVPNQNTQNYGSTYGQNIEPAGEYMNMDTMQGKHKIDGYEYGTIQFKKPLVLEHINTSDTGWKKTVSDMYNGLTGKKLTEALINDGYDAILTYDDYGYNEIVNLNGKKLSDQGVRFSMSEEVDKNYLDAVNRGDTETAQRIVNEVAKNAMPDSKLRTPDGNLRIVYHGTNTGDFTVFNPDYIGMSSGDDGFFGMGFYFAYSKGEASYYGASRVIPAYLDLKNPFDFEKELQSYKGKKASSGYAPDAVALMNFADKFPEIANNVTIGVVENGSNTGKQISLREFSEAFKEVINNKAFEYSEVENEFGEKETVVTADPKTIEYEYNGEKHSYKDYGFQKRFWGTPNELDVAYEYLANSVFEYVDMIPRTRLIIDNNREFTSALKKMGHDGAIQSEHGDEAVVFDPAQIKSAEPVTYDDKGRIIPLSDRFNPENEDIRYSLSAEGEKHPVYGNYNVSGKDIALESGPVAEDVAPVQETVSPVTEETELFPDAPFAQSAVAELDKLNQQKEALEGRMLEAVGAEDYDTFNQLNTEYTALMQELEALDQEVAAEDADRINSLTEADIPPEMDAPYYGDNQTNQVDDPFEDRDWYEVGNKKVKAYMYENPEVKPFFQEEALKLLGELNDTTRGERWYNDELYYESGGEAGFGGVKRQTSASMEELLDSWGMSYADIEKGLNAIIEDHGAENIAAAKKLEFMLNDRLLNGYKDFYTNSQIPPNQDYINLLNEKQITEYSKESFDALMANADQIAPPVADESAAFSGGDVAPVFSEVKTEQKNVLEGQQATFEGAGKEADTTPKQQTRKELHSNIIDNIKARFSERGFDLDNVLKSAKNLPTFATVDNTPQRVMEKALGYKEGQILSDLTVNQVAQNETEGIKWLNSFTDRKNGLLAQLSKRYNIKPGSKESAAAQMYAEGFYVNEKNEIIKYGDAELAKDFPDLKVQAGIKGLANDPRIRQIYDDTLAMINESRTRNAYPEIPRLENYFLHFRAMDDTFSKLGLPFNPNDIRAKDLPTDLNGVTADLKPGQPYFSSAMHRKGKRTSFDLLGGLERYLTSAKNQIYHIDDIQTLRALRNYVADTYGQANGLEGLDVLSEEEAQQRIEQVYNSHLSTFAKFLNEEANVLAGKTALIDRGLEGILGRRGMTFLDTVNKQVGSNMVGFNVSSALTNVLPVVQTFAKTNKADFVKAFGQTVGNKIGSIFGRTDGFSDNSPVIIRRKGADRFYRTPFQKVGDAGYVFMGVVDDISTELIARTKYNELTRNGMDSQKAHYETDKWVSRLMGDRSLGQMPQLYNSKMLGLFTKFQLEVRNQLDSQFYDTIQEAKVSNEHIKNGLARNAKTAAKVASTFAQLAVAQHIFGKAFESVAGYNPAFDIIGVLMTAFGFDDEEDSEDTVLDNVEQGFLDLLEDLPYTSTLTGGRIPISSALPIKELVTGKDDYGTEKSRLETLGEIAPYYVLPTGYGQIKKTAQGLEMFSDEHPISGSYTDSGGLRFPVDDTLANRVQAGIFGQWASENARTYFDNDLAPLNQKQVKEYAELDISYDEYWEYRDDMKAISERADKKGASDKDIVQSKYINSVDSELSAIQAEKKSILKDTSLTIKEKAEKIGELDKQFADLVNERYRSYDDVSFEGDGEYAVIGDSYFQWYTPEEGDPYWRKMTESQVTKYNLTKNAGDAHYVTDGNVHYRLDEEGKWTKISDKQLERQNEVTKALGITPEEYWRKTEISFFPMSDGEYEYAYDNPENYAVAKAVGGYDAYRGYSKDLYDIKADKDKNGNSISGSRKEKVLDYINNLDADYGEKIILYKSQYPSDDTYNYDIIDYLNGRDDISYSEMETILTELGFKVSSDGTITWD